MVVRYSQNANHRSEWEIIACDLGMLVSHALSLVRFCARNWWSFARFFEFSAEMNKPPPPPPTISESSPKSKHRAQFSEDPQCDK